jgi:hypothetical protein
MCDDEVADPLGEGWPATGNRMLGLHGSHEGATLAVRETYEDADATSVR